MRALLPLAAVIVALAGCGGSDEPLSQADYEREMREVVADLEEQDEIAAPDDSASNEEQGEYVEQLQERVRDAADRFDEVKAPNEVAEAHADYVAGIRGLADDMEPVAEAARNGDQEALLRFQEESPYPSAETQMRITAARTGFRRAGYQISEEFP
jgi:hypothetical protein